MVGCLSTSSYVTSHVLSRYSGPGGGTRLERGGGLSVVDEMSESVSERLENQGGEELCVLVMKGGGGRRDSQRKEDVLM